jgi:hypothetical protein
LCLFGDGRAHLPILVQCHSSVVLCITFFPAFTVALSLLCHRAARELGNGLLKDISRSLEVLEVDGQRQKCEEFLLPYSPADAILEAPVRKNIINASQVVTLHATIDFFCLQTYTNT